LIEKHTKEELTVSNETKNWWHNCF